MIIDEVDMSLIISKEICKGSLVVQIEFKFDEAGCWRRFSLCLRFLNGYIRKCVFENFNYIVKINFIAKA